MREMKKEEEIKFTPPAHWLEDEEHVVPDTDPELAHPGCLSPSRLDQHGEKAQDAVDKDAHPESDMKTDVMQGKSASCTANEGLCSELEVLRSSIPNTLQAIITFERHSVQMFFSPENAVTDLKRKVKEIWNIPEKVYYLLINGSHESITPKSWPKVVCVQVKMKGLLGGSPIRYRYATRYEGKGTKGSGPVIMVDTEDSDKKTEGESWWTRLSFVLQPPRNLRGRRQWDF
jgi:hypothetical protein